MLIKRRGIDVKRFYPTGGRYDLELFQQALAETKPRLVFFEAISNPMLIVSDGIAVIEAAKDAGAVVLLDNTFASPFLRHPLDAGADIVIHSATKFLSGHNNLTAGVVCGNNRQMEKDAIYR